MTAKCQSGVGCPSARTSSDAGTIVLPWRLEREVALLDIDHPNGFAVRPHNLGDFYSVRYV